MRHEHGCRARHEHSKPANFALEREKHGNDRGIRGSPAQVRHGVNMAFAGMGSRAEERLVALEARR